MSIVFRIDGHQFTGPTQILPQHGSVCKEQAAEAFKKLSETLRTHGEIPTTGYQKVTLAPNCFGWREYRTATKNVLSALANALVNSLPGGYTMANSKPPNALCPAGITGERLSMSPSEKKVFHLGGQSGELKFIYNFKTHESFLDYYVHEDFARLVFCADEGTEAGRAKNQDSDIMFDEWQC